MALMHPASSDMLNQDGYMDCLRWLEQGAPTRKVVREARPLPDFVGMIPGPSRWMSFCQFFWIRLWKHISYWNSCAAHMLSSVTLKWQCGVGLLAEKSVRMCAARTPSNSRSNPASETLGRSCQKGSDLRAEISFPSCWPQAFPSRDLLIWDAFEAYIMVVRSRIPEWLFWLATSTREVVFHSERHWLHHFLLTDFSIAKFVSKEAVFARDLSRASIRARWKLGGEWTCTRLLHELEVKVYM